MRRWSTGLLGPHFAITGMSHPSLLLSVRTCPMPTDVTPADVEELSQVLVLALLHCDIGFYFRPLSNAPVDSQGRAIRDVGAFVDKWIHMVYLKVLKSQIGLAREMTKLSLLGNS